LLSPRSIGAAAELRWQSFDGLELAGLLIKPLGYQLGVRYPVVVDVHGGPEGGISLDAPAVLTSTPQACGELRQELRRFPHCRL
jgi:dipeptidyl aminopeptidase/acylaminoacyl peptidase